MVQYAPFDVKQANYIKQCLNNRTWLSVAEGGK
ncbi:hypothetical protein SAMN05660900_00869 [Megasphaera cerevisiae DSM 20462]|nr:hypothetical protein SAMN05660900_00869 [Megasphaera cerevisiae DSM 20462]